MLYDYTWHLLAVKTFLGSVLTCLSVVRYHNLQIESFKLDAYVFLIKNN